jgi:hypothetical protein
MIDCAARVLGSGQYVVLSDERASLVTATNNYPRVDIVKTVCKVQCFELREADIRQSMEKINWIEHWSCHFPLQY